MLVNIITVCLLLLYLFQKENIGDLLIVNAQLSQAGMYTCTAQTVVDSAFASAKLVVRGEYLVCPLLLFSIGSLFTAT